MSERQMKTIDLPFKDKLYRFALNIVGDSMDAEDILQELMIKIWRRIEQFETLDNKEAWCMTVTRNLAIDKTRSRKATMHDIADYQHLSDNSTTPDKQLENDERFGNIMKLVNQLPEKQRQIVHLRDVEGYTYQEIADMMETNLDFVKISLHRARKSLKEQLLRQNIRKYEA
jgi:RNA polymerase sigma factor (sigma-70 family)